MVNVPTVRRMLRRSRTGADDEDDADGERPPEEDEDERPRRVPVRLFWGELARLLAQAGAEWAHVAEQLVAFGPKNVGPNMLVDASGQLRRRYVGGVRG